MRPTTYFYPRPPRGGRHCQRLVGRADIGFLSTPSARRATLLKIEAKSQKRNFYPRPPRGGRQTKNQPFCPKKLFLSTPSARRATQIAQMNLLFEPFLSTPSARRATCSAAAEYLRCREISIHALREEGDRQRLQPQQGQRDFYPRPPRGGRRESSPVRYRKRYFYPRPPRGGRPFAVPAHPA